MNISAASIVPPEEPHTLHAFLLKRATLHRDTLPVGTAVKGQAAERRADTRLHVQQILNGELRDANELDGQVFPRRRRQVFRRYLGESHLTGTEQQRRK